MTIVGHQDLWVAGARVIFTRDADAGANPNPPIDLGTVQNATPSIEPNVLQLFDGDGGGRTLVDQSLSSLEETWEVVLSNMSVRNLAFLFLPSRS